MSSAAERAGAALGFATDAAAARAWLSDAKAVPGCLLVSSEAELRAFAEWVRDRAELFAVPLVALVRQPTYAEHLEAYRAGCDDAVLASDAGGLTRRLANLRTNSAVGRPEATQGRAIVAASDATQRRQLGRTLRHAGFEVAFAASTNELEQLVGDGKASLAVATTSMAPAAADMTPDQTPGMRRVGGVPLMIVRGHEESQPGERTSQVLFFADEQAAGQFRDRRSSARKLFPTLCTFREAASFEPVYGVSHNMSRDGMYVRTLDPPRPGSLLRIELRLPPDDALVHLRARAVWQRMPGSGRGVLPVGFGLQLQAEACSATDLAAWIEGYAHLPD